MNEKGADEQPAAWTLYSSKQRRGFLAILFLVSATSYLDRHIFSVLIEPIKAEFGASGTIMGLLSGFAFVALYATLGIPVARWADVGNRRTIITLSLIIWSVMTVLCGMAGAVWQMALARIGVGAGEAGAIPPSQSLIADCFPPERRATALAVFFYLRQLRACLSVWSAVPMLRRTMVGGRQ
jgi:MFS family permease